MNWILAALLAAVAGILISPLTTVAPSVYTLFIVPALAAALIGPFRSFWLTAAGGLLLGILQSELTKLETVWTWLPTQGLVSGLPLLIVIVVVGVFGRGVVSRSSLRVRTGPKLGAPTMPMRSAAMALAAGAVLLLALHGPYRAGAISSIVAIPVLLSVVVLTGYVGQISLVQMGLAGIGGFALTHLATESGSRSRCRSYSPR